MRPRQPPRSQHMPPDIAEILKRFDLLPDDAVVPTRVTAVVHGVSERTVRRTYPSVQLSPNRKGQRVGTIRAMSRGEKPAA
jgi:hypothetical protein